MRRRSLRGALRLTLIAVGRVAEPFIREACDHYAERILRYGRFSLTVVPEERVSSAGRKAYILRREGEKIRTRLSGDAVVVALDERGQALTSAAFARSLEKWSHGGSKEVAFYPRRPLWAGGNIMERSGSLSIPLIHDLDPWDGPNVSSGTDIPGMHPPTGGTLP